MRLFQVALSATLGLLVACSDGGHDHDHDHHHDHDHDHDHGEEGHVHTAPHGGELLVLAEEFAHVELVLDRATGTLDAYSLGAHADTPVRLAQESLTVVLPDFELELAAVASTLTGDTVGDASRFQVTDERLATDAELSGTVKWVESLGQRFEDVEFTLHGEPAE